MIYLLRKQHLFGMGTMTTHWELWQYESRSEHTGALLNGKKLKEFKTKTQAKDYCGRRGIPYTEGR